MSLRTGSVFLLTTLAALAFLGLAPFTAHANPAQFTLFGRIISPAGWGFTSGTVMSPGPDLTVLPGESVTLSLTSADSAFHNWGVDYNNNGSPDAGEPLSNTFGSSGTTFTFTATTLAGTYNYHCFIHPGPMVGKFIVQDVVVPDFTISANPTTVGPINVGAQGTSTIAINPVNGFSGRVDLTSRPSAGLTANVNPTFVSGGSGTSTLTVSASAPGSYTVNVTGTSGPLSHQVRVSVDVVGPDFTISANPTTIGPLNPSVQGTSMITIGSVNGFSGSVDLTTSPSAGLTANVNPTTVPGGSGTSTLTVSAGAVGSYTVTVSGTSGPLSHSVVVTVNVVAPDFSLSAASNISFSQGSTGSFTVNLQSLSGFLGNVALTATITPAGPTVSPSSTTVALAQGGVGSFVVTVSAVGGVYSTVSVGVYTVRVTGVSGSVSHSVDVAVNVTSQGGPGVGNVPLYYLVGGVVAVVGAAAAVVFLVRRGRSKK